MLNWQGWCRGKLRYLPAGSTDRSQSTWDGPSERGFRCRYIAMAGCNFRDPPDELLLAHPPKARQEPTRPFTCIRFQSALVYSSTARAERQQISACHDFRHPPPRRSGLWKRACVVVQSDGIANSHQFLFSPEVPLWKYGSAYTTLLLPQ